MEHFHLPGNLTLNVEQGLKRRNPVIADRKPQLIKLDTDIIRFSIDQEQQVILRQLKIVGGDDLFHDSPRMITLRHRTDCQVCLIVLLVEIALQRTQIKGFISTVGYRPFFLTVHLEISIPKAFIQHHLPINVRFHFHRERAAACSGRMIPGKFESRIAHRLIHRRHRNFRHIQCLLLRNGICEAQIRAILRDGNLMLVNDERAGTLGPRVIDLRRNDDFIRTGITRRRGYLQPLARVIDPPVLIRGIGKGKGLT